MRLPLRNEPLVDPWSSMKISPVSFTLTIRCLREISWSDSKRPKLDARPIKQLVQQHLADKEVCADDVGKSRVESVADLFKALLSVRLAIKDFG